MAAFLFYLFIPPFYVFLRNGYYKESLYNQKLILAGIKESTLTFLNFRVEDIA